MGLLEDVIAVTMVRRDNYDSPLPNFLRIALYWSIWDERINSPLDVAFKMDLMKSAREQHSHNDDNLIDKGGYALSCYEQIDARMRELGYERGAEELRYWGDQARAGAMTPGAYVGWMFDLLLYMKGEFNTPPVPHADRGAIAGEL